MARGNYSVHYSLIGQRVDARLSPHTVEIFRRGQLIATHARAVRRYQRRTIEAHRPPAHRAYLALGIDSLLTRAERVGPATREILERHFARKALTTQVPQRVLLVFGGAINGLTQRVGTFFISLQLH